MYDIIFVCVPSCCIVLIRRKVVESITLLSFVNPIKSFPFSPSFHPSPQVYSNKENNAILNYMHIVCRNPPGSGSLNPLLQYEDRHPPPQACKKSPCRQ